jgi:Putative zinc-finger
MMVCRKARKQFPALVERPWDYRGERVELSAAERAALELHLKTCESCAFEYRVYSLTQTTLNLAAQPEAVEPDENFFKGLRARIARGPEIALASQQDESWASAMMVTARQMIPAMAMLLLLILGASLLWNNTPGKLGIPSSGESQALNQRDESAELTPDDVLENFVAVEERWDGR